MIVGSDCPLSDGSDAECRSTGTTKVVHNCSANAITTVGSVNVPAGTTKKSWILASVVLIAASASCVLEAQLLAVGFALHGNQTVARLDVLDGNATLHAGNGSGGATFHAPYFYTLCRVIGRTSAFPILFLGFWLYSTVVGRSFSAKQFLRQSVKVMGPGPDGVTVIGFFKLFTLPALFQLFVSIGLVVAVAYVAPSIMSSCMSGAVAISYVLSMIFLKLPHSIVKTVFVFVAFGGIGMIAYATTNGTLASGAYIGIIAALGTAISLSLFQLSYKKSFQTRDPFQSALIVSMIFVLCTLVYWPVPVATKLTGAEVWEWSQIPWGYLIGAVLSSVSFSFLYMFGLSLSSPFFMSLSEMLNLTLSGVVDHFARGVYLKPLQIAGFVVVGVSFLILILPEEILTLTYLRERVTSGQPTKKLQELLQPGGNSKNRMSILEPNNTAIRRRSAGNLK